MTETHKRQAYSLKDRNAAFERWLREEVAPVYDTMRNGPARGIAIEDGLAEIRQKHANELK